MSKNAYKYAKNDIFYAYLVFCLTMTDRVSSRSMLLEAVCCLRSYCIYGIHKIRASKQGPTSKQDYPAVPLCITTV